MKLTQKRHMNPICFLQFYEMVLFFTDFWCAQSQMTITHYLMTIIHYTLPSQSAVFSSTREVLVILDPPLHLFSQVTIWLKLPSHLFALVCRWVCPSGWKECYPHSRLPLIFSQLSELWSLWQRKKWMPRGQNQQEEPGEKQNPRRKVLNEACGSALMLWILE